MTRDRQNFIFGFKFWDMVDTEAIHNWYPNLRTAHSAQLIAMDGIFPQTTENKFLKVIQILLPLIISPNFLWTWHQHPYSSSRYTIDG